MLHHRWSDAKLRALKSDRTHCWSASVWAARSHNRCSTSSCRGVNFTVWMAPVSPAGAQHGGWSGLVDGASCRWTLRQTDRQTVMSPLFMEAGYELNSPGSGSGSGSVSAEGSNTGGSVSRTTHSPHLSIHHVQITTSCHLITRTKYSVTCTKSIT